MSAANAIFDVIGDAFAASLKALKHPYRIFQRTKDVVLSSQYIASPEFKHIASCMGACEEAGYARGSAEFYDCVQHCLRGKQDAHNR